MKLVNKFNPLQPEWKKNIQSLQMSKTSPPFQNSIVFVYQFKTKGNINENILFPSIPNGCIDLLFHLDGIQSQCLLVPSPKKRTFLPFSAYSTYFGIRLFPLQKLFPFQLSLKEINSEKAFSLFEVAPYLRPLYELLLQKHTFIEQMQLLECYLKHPRNSQLYSTIVASCINKIIFHHGHLHVKDLEQFTGYSERYLRLLFQKELGIPPKTFLQLVNFQYIINDIVKGDFHIEKHLNENLYYDSSHFYKTFKKFTNMTPGEYRKILVDEV